MSAIIYSSVIRFREGHTPSAESAVKQLHTHGDGNYALSALGYAIDIVRKSVMLVFNTLVLVFSWHKMDSRYMKCRAVIVIDNILALAICPIGVIAPPLAYRLDDAAQEFMLKFTQRQVML